MDDAVKSDELLKKKGTGTRVEQSAPDAEFQKTAAGHEVYDLNERVVTKMNRLNAMFDRDIFFQELFENYLVSVERHEPRQLPDSKIILQWDLHTTFEDFLADALKVLEKKIEATKFAKAVGTQRLAAIDDSVMDDQTFKADAGSDVLGKKFSSEDHDAVYELLRRSKEAIEDALSGRSTIIVNSHTGRVRIGGSTGIITK